MNTERKMFVHIHESCKFEYFSHLKNHVGLAGIPKAETVVVLSQMSLWWYATPEPTVCLVLVNESMDLLNDVLFGRNQLHLHKCPIFSAILI